MTSNVKKRIDLSYPIHSLNTIREIAVIIMLSKNVKYLLKEPVKTGEKYLKKGVYTDSELNATIGLEAKSQMGSLDYVSKKNKLENITKMVISLGELNNSDNLEDGKPSNALLIKWLLMKILCVSNPTPLNIRNLRMARLLL